MKRALYWGLLATLCISPAIAQEVVYEPGPGITVPRVVKDVKPRYSREGLDKGIQGVVWLGVVVQSDGTVGDVTIKKPLEPSLDEEAVAAARQWIFKPGERDGKAVAVRVTLEMTFVLRKPKGN